MNDSPRPWHRVGRLAAEHQGLVLPLAYVGLVLLGMFHMAVYYWRFRINVLQYAQPGDFLLSPLADPFIIVVSILPVFLFAAIGRFNRWWGPWWRSRFRIVRTPEQLARDERTYRILQVTGALLWIIALGLTYARWRVEAIEEGRTPRVQVELTNGNRLGSARDSTVAMIGTTSQFAFFYTGRRDSTTGAPRVTIVPVGNVARIDQAPRVRRPKFLLGNRID